MRWVSRVILGRSSLLRLVIWYWLPPRKFPQLDFRKKGTGSNWLGLGLPRLCKLGNLVSYKRFPWFCQGPNFGPILSRVLTLEFLAH